MMYLSSLRLKNFRNIKETEIQFNPRVNIILGQNGQGKTNLLEAIYFLGIARSFRTSQDSTLITWDGDGFFLSGVVAKQHIQDKIDVLLEGTKRVRINSKFLPRIIDLIGHLLVSVFFPEDLHLIKGTPDLRRRFLDILLSQSNPQYLYHLQQYQKILKQRNEMLWQLKIGMNDMPVDMLSVWDTQMQSAASQIVEAREEAIRNIEGIASGIHQQIIIANETFKMSYKPSIFTPDKRSNEIRRGCTLSGPHLDDILFQINGVDARHGSSQGQQRTAAISLRLAEMECLYQQTEELPVLLLDDVCSELDESRRGYLMKAINRGGQIFITTTELDTVKELIDGATVFEVKEGGIACNSSSAFS
ncbi:DNA replication/repair protein RecF [Candidatus Desantisbacteria bacterium CG_4_9_14_3_um_filter_40_11]|uniref:DNA replication and repair protein RecF n=5 Tax=unclassified Candidatus Desantisiibacteriota TaxID=3106372 RepID=A0A2M7JF97_9BACT|nr:MAG: DNA replication/repair protein RecF [Candidatus Desantisbacteria bacterium CG23_combo_of_CG06-09_8_20_14_all_40_23]PIX18056.1 MAG: DNA replication/repair protein RecF [Candidatus Desantisbacteria bacterium CG_4_8_14_3_um_filter_40_12]PIY19014.1 MAG: DNA replication/repair protein RecF [Candidatus Desantisbacteria bacterium CG_4_10_14_3_um_filter_40_18]PJB29251.1 MAG: DNA replication/repair protein RecF [Candidatus Desantisbacteria bacterium CG_4_9_14_3_um_filter_40_11]